MRFDTPASVIIASTTLFDRNAASSSVACDNARRVSELRSLGFRVAVIPDEAIELSYSPIGSVNVNASVAQLLPAIEMN